MRVKKILGALAVIGLGAISMQFVAAQAASAHTPSVHVTCSAWSFGATNYQTDQDNTYSYSVDGAASVTGSFGAQFSESGTFADGSGNHTLAGYIYQDNQPQATYSYTFDLSTEGCSTIVAIPAAPLPNAPTCTEAGSPAVPADTDTVHWSLTGDVATATAQGANKFTDGTTTKSFTENVLSQLDQNSDDCAAHVSVPVPAFTNGDCNTAPTLVGATEGTGYTVVIDGTADFGSTVTVTFTAKPNFRLDGQTVYSFDYAAKPDCNVAASPVAPAVEQSVCTGPGTASIAMVNPVDTTGITYALSADLSTVTATPDSGYEFGPLPAGWTLRAGVAEFETGLVSPGDCTESVVAIASTFANDRCESSVPTGSTFTLPEVTGADYFVGGVKTPAGTYPATDGSTVTVTIQAQGGYTLTGTTSWSHTFDEAPTCAGVSGEHITPLPAQPAQPVIATASTGLAATGTPTMSLVLIGGLLAVLGGALCVATTDRRWFRR